MKVIGVILFCSFVVITSHAFDMPTTFQNLESRLSDAQKQEVLDHSIDLRAAKGDKERQSLLAILLFRKLDDKKIGIDLLRNLLDKYGIDLQNSPTPLFHYINFSQLANEYIEGKNTPPDPVTAIKILLDLANRGFEGSDFMLGYTLAYTGYFPEAEYLMNVWNKRKKGIEQIHINKVLSNFENRFDDKELTQPDTQLFKSCGKPFKKDKKTIKRFHQIQNDILNNGKVTQAQLTQYYASLGHSEPFNMEFNHIEAQNILMLLVDMISMNTGQQFYSKFSDNFLDDMVNISFKKVPSELVYQQLLEVLNIQVTCYQDWLMFKDIDGDVPVSKTTIIANFMTKQEILNDNTVTIVWENGVEYQGGYIQGVIQGSGKYIYSQNGTPIKVIEGFFKNGKLDGMGKEYLIDGSLSITGNFHNGLLNGQGHYIDENNQIDQNGEFINGNFQMPNNYEQYFVREDEKTAESLPVNPDLILKNKKNLNNYILYKGPFVENKPNGKGHCYLKELSYDCTFYRGYLVGLEDFSLLPDNIVFKD